ncbi:hypothetical protein Leryth_006438 [Lithospermum erythrorhizon]|nr:hypothetical protein Leryth_006438 [Lithospermum erythrorhizon]
MGSRQLLLLKIFKKDDDDDDKEKDYSPCPQICYLPCSGCKIQEDTLIYPPPSPPLPPPSSPNHTSSILILVSCLLGFSFVIVSYLVIMRYRMSVRNSRRRNSQSLHGDSFMEEFLDENHGPLVAHPIWFIRTAGLNQSVIDSISIIRYKSGDGLVEGGDCSVCLGEFEEDESLRLLPKCSHAFHIHCIDTWLRAHKNCPLCRAPIVVGDENGPRVNLEEANSDNVGNEEENGVESLNNIEEVEGGTSRVLVENGSNVSSPIEERSSENEFPQKNSDFKHERGKRVRVRSDFVDHRVMMVVDEEIEPVRRSMSMDSGTAPLIYHEKRNKFQLKDEGPSHSYGT